MNELVILMAIVLLLASVLAVLRDIHSDDPRRHPSYQPPQSHPGDSFGRTGHSFR